MLRQLDLRVCQVWLLQSHRTHVVILCHESFSRLPTTFRFDSSRLSLTLDCLIDLLIDLNLRH